MTQINGFFDPAHGSSLSASGLVHAELAVLQIPWRLDVEFKIDTGSPGIFVLDEKVLEALLQWGFVPPRPNTRNPLPPVPQACQWMGIRPYWFTPPSKEFQTINGTLRDVFAVKQAVVRLCNRGSPPDGGARELDPVYFAFSERYRTKGRRMLSLLGRKGINAVQSLIWSARKDTITLYDR